MVGMSQAHRWQSRAHQGALFGQGRSVVFQPCQLVSCCVSAVALRHREAACHHGPQPACALEAWHSRVCWGGKGFQMRARQLLLTG